MSLSHSPKIVTSGLVLHLDAANKRSFNPSENLLTYTNSIGISGQKYLVSATPIITLNATTAPDGTLTATKIDNNGNSTSNYLYAQGDVVLSTSTTYTYSIFLKPSSSNLVYITLDEADFGGKRYQLYFNTGDKTVTTQTIGVQSNGAILSSGVVEYPNQWYRVYITFTTGSATVSGLVEMISRYSTSNVGYNYFWGRQLEKGPVMTDYTSVLTTGIASRPTIWTNLSGNSNNGTLTNGPTYSSLNNGSIIFNGSNQYVVGPSISSQLTGDMTAEVWMKLNAVPTDYVRIIGTGVNSGSSRTFGLWVNSNDRNLLWQRHGSGAQDPALLPATRLTLGTWNHIVATTSGSSHAIYLNGVSIGTASATGPWPESAQNISLGYGYIHTYLNGSLSGAKLYNRGLTGSEVKQNYDALKGRYSL
jgi:hypothetical protein